MVDDPPDSPEVVGLTANPICNATEEGRCRDFQKNAQAHETAVGDARQKAEAIRRISIAPVYRWFSRREAVYEEESLSIEARRRANADAFSFGRVAMEWTVRGNGQTA
jgi:hypothetical protein